MRRLVLMTAVVAMVAGMAGCTYRTTNPRAVADLVVSGAEATISDFKKDPTLADFKPAIDQAKGIVILPSLIKAAFVAGGAGGDGVLLVRRPDGSWSYPAFYTLAAGSVGIQGGIQDTQVVLVLRSEKAVQAVLKHQAKLGADAGLTVGVFGGGVGAATTTNMGADILVYAQSKVGLYGGITLDGAVLVRRTDLNEAYYATGAEPRAIVMDGRFSNPQADALRAELARP